MDSEPFDDPPSVLISADVLRVLTDAAYTVDDTYPGINGAIEEAESALERYK